MKVEKDSWDIDKLIDMKDSIELTPVWQRGPAWKRPRQVLLIDSILRGMDIPKVYLRKLSQGVFTHDAVDGQQRLRAIWQFHSNDFDLTHPDPLPPIEGEEVHAKKFGDLSPKLQERFTKFKISVGEITNSSAAEIRNLFARLQMGVSLNPAELRNAMDGPLRYSIDSTARLHPFFAECRISSDRYKHLDYAAHAYAIAAYRGTRDLKAPDLRAMISEYGADRGVEVLQLSALVDEALDILAIVNKHLGHSITQKWIFVDLFWLIVQIQSAGGSVDIARFTKRFVRFESLRREYNPQADKLLRPGSHPNVSSTLSKHLYAYVEAFRVQGGVKANLVVRNRALRAFCT